LKKRLPFTKPHARYDYQEKTFVCSICERCGLVTWGYCAWEIPKHLKSTHKICRKDQLISGWNEGFEKEYLKNREKPVEYEPDKDAIVINQSSVRDTKKEKKRIEEELKMKRDPW
jgi:hypothetical protein